MKNFNKWLFTVCTVIVAYSCSETILTEGISEKELLPVCVHFSEDSRAAYNPDFSLSFTDGEEMSVMETALGDITYPRFNQVKSLFEGKVYVPRTKPQAGFDICASMGYKTMDIQSIAFDIPDEQYGVGLPKIVSKVKVQDLSNVQLPMKQVASFMAVNINPVPTDGIESIEFSSVAGEKITGTAVYDVQKGTTAFTGRSSSLMVRFSTPVSENRKVVLNVLPVVLTRGAVMKIRSVGGAISIWELNGGKSIDLRENQVLNLTRIIDQVSFTGGVVYSSYMRNGQVQTRNDVDGSEINIEGFKVNGVDLSKVTKAGYLLDGVDVPGQTMGEDGIITTVAIKKVAWGEHVIKAYAEAGGKTFHSKDYRVTVTGIPYNAVPPQKTGDHPWKVSEGDDIRWEKDRVVLAAITKQPGIVSPIFYITANTPVNVSTKAVRNKFMEWLIGEPKFGVEICDASGAYLRELKGLKMGNGAVFEYTIPVTMTATERSFKCIYHYGATGPKTSIYYFKVVYQ